MQMADIHVPFNQAWTVVNDPNSKLSATCNQCHRPVAVQGQLQNNSAILDNFGVVLSKQGTQKDKMVLLAPFVINTTEPTKTPILTQIAAAAGVTRANIGAICTQFMRNQ